MRRVLVIGSNGAGKSTLAAELRARLPLPSELVYMGLWKLDEPGGAQGVGAALRRPLRMWRRYAGAQLLQLQGRVVVFDRYVYDAHLPPSPPFVSLKRIYQRALGPGHLSTGKAWFALAQNSFLAGKLPVAERQVAMAERRLLFSCRERGPVGE